MTVPYGLTVRDSETKVSADEQSIGVSITATFTADLLQETLLFWAAKLGLNTHFHIEPPNQVFQTLYSTQTTPSSNRNFQIHLIRLQDWAGLSNELSSQITAIRASLTEFKLLLRQAKTTQITIFCPSTGSFAQNAEFLAFEESELKTFKEESGLVYTHLDVSTLYPLEKWENAYTDQLVQIPYQEKVFVALATFIIRKIRASLYAPYKMIVTDCDNTLWQGVCGEIGWEQIIIGESEKALQHFLLKEKEKGMLVCLCSKNTEKDVLEVFKNKPDMALSLSDIASYQINWDLKSLNIQRLAKDMNLGSDSAIFIDDNPLECEEVKNHVPGAITIRVPSAQELKPQNMARFLEHLWVFDRLYVTEEDKTRTALYKQENQRNQEKSQAIDLKSFIKSLDLRLTMQSLQEEDILRVAQLAQRTNQFNLTTRRENIDDISQALKADTLIKTLTLQDRFGDYGLIGAVFLEPDNATLLVKNIFISCRALGRGVEFRILNELGKIAQEKQLNTIHFSYKATQKNIPAKTFLESISAEYLDDNGSPFYQIDTKTAIDFEPPYDKTVETLIGIPSEGSKKSDKINTTALDPATIWHIAMELNTVDKIEDAVKRERKSCKNNWEASPREYVAPMTDLQKEIAAVWSEVTRVSSIGITDNFFSLGGNSLLLVQMLSILHERLGKEISINTVFEYPVLEDFAKAVGSDAPSENPMLLGFNTKGRRSPIFCIPNPKTTYIQLPKALGEDRPFYIFQHGIERACGDKKRAEDVAEHYANIVKSACPTGPYTIMGSCMVSTQVALELARRLSMDGQKTNLLLVDPQPIQLRPIIYGLIFTNLYRLKKIVTLPFKEKKSYIHSLIEEKRQQFSNPQLTTGIDVRAYKVKPFTSNLYLFLCKDIYIRIFGFDPRKKWKRFAPDCEIFEFDGKPLSMVANENVSRVAAILNERLE